MKIGDKLRVVGARVFKVDLRWLEGEIVEVVEVHPSGVIQVKHSKEPELYFSAGYLEACDEK